MYSLFLIKQYAVCLFSIQKKDLFLTEIPSSGQKQALCHLHWILTRLNPLFSYRNIFFCIPDILTVDCCLHAYRTSDGTIFFENGIRSSGRYMYSGKAHSRIQPSTTRQQLQ